MTAQAEAPATDQAAVGHIRDFHAALQAATGVSLPIRLPDGTDIGPPDASFRLVLNHWWSLRLIWLPPYDLPADFYRLFLDKRQVYSCAYFLDPAASLDEAQERKLDLICHKLRLEPGQRLLDIGCGW